MSIVVSKDFKLNRFIKFDMTMILVTYLVYYGSTRNFASLLPSDLGAGSNTYESKGDANTAAMRCFDQPRT
ncbi:hypothetical protein H5410_042271 [Solanum commersonii]|uniref:Uncharacterized protein n=1 Tax=Solanum commersonii TaxID=4109 RepID=A0A9J5XV99_SOLCO|nr:hypothetical protein H5410_042271 [Solanum commersonii]